MDKACVTGLPSKRHKAMGDPRVQLQKGQLAREESRSWSGTRVMSAGYRVGKTESEREQERRLLSAR